MSTAANKTALTYATFGEPTTNIIRIYGTVASCDPGSCEVEAVFDVDGQREELPFEASEISHLVHEACEGDCLEGERVYIEFGLDVNGGSVFGPLHLAEEAAKANTNKEHTMSAQDNTTELVATAPEGAELNGATNHPTAEPVAETAAVVEQPAAETAAPEAQADTTAEGEDEDAVVIGGISFFKFTGKVHQTQSFRVQVNITPETQVDLDVRNPRIIFWRERPGCWSADFVADFEAKNPDGSRGRVWPGATVEFLAGRDDEDHLQLRDLRVTEYVDRAGGPFVYTGPRQQQQRPQDNRRQGGRDQGRQPQGNQRQGGRDQGRQPQGNQRQGGRDQGRQPRDNRPRADAAPAKVERYAGTVYMVQQAAITIALNDRAQEALNKLRVPAQANDYSVEFAEAMAANKIITGKTVVTFAWDGRRAVDVKLAKTQPADKVAAK